MAFGFCHGHYKIATKSIGYETLTQIYNIKVSGQLCMQSWQILRGKGLHVAGRLGGILVRSLVQFGLASSVPDKQEPHERPHFQRAKRGSVLWKRTAQQVSTATKVTSIFNN